jgi:hypothetical protein
MQEQIDPERVQLGQEAHEVLQAAAEPINRPGHDHIELAHWLRCAVPRRHQARLSRPLAPLNAVILVDLDDLAAHAAGDLAQLALLISSRLIDCADAKVHNSSFHGSALPD